MIRKKTSKEDIATKKTTRAKKPKLKVDKQTEKVQTIEVVNLDKELESAKELSGTGIQAFMREAIQNATRGK